MTSSIRKSPKRPQPRPGLLPGLLLALAMIISACLLAAPPLPAQGDPGAGQGGGPGVGPGVGQGVGAGQGAPQGEGQAPGQEGDPEAQGAKGPISITSDHMVADDSTKIVTFTGKVVARQGDLVISCDRMRVRYVPKGSYQAGPQGPAQGPPLPPVPQADSATPAQPSLPPPAGAAAPAGGGRSPLEGGQEIDQVDCSGAVKIQQGDRLAVGDKALYLARALPRRLVLTGNARVWQGENSVTGHQITYYLDENRSLVDSQTGGRVRAFYNQGASGGAR